MALMQRDGATRFSLFSDPETASLVPEQILHPVEREMYKTMSAARKVDFLKGRYAIKSILNYNPAGQMSRVLIAAASSGKPYVPSNPKLFCSISHADGYAAAAISAQTAIGVDIEKLKNRHPALLRSISDPEEIERLSLVYPPEIITTVVWAIKEAAAKADESIYSRKTYKVSSGDRVLVQRAPFQWEVSVTILPMYVSAIALAI